MLIGSHVGMSGKEMFLGSVKEALSYGSTTFMVYTGAPQNTRRKPIEELNIEAGRKLMQEAGLDRFVVHAPYIINLANTVKTETYELAVEVLESEIKRTTAMGGHSLVLHPGSHVDAGADAGIAQIIKGLNQVLTKDTPIYIALETMAGKGSEIGRSFEELAAIFDGVVYNDKLRVCFDTCHVNDAGYDLTQYDKVMDEFDRILGKERISVFHVNDSMNERGTHKDRHENFGFGTIGYENLMQVIMDPYFSEIPKILETPYVALPGEKAKTIPPYRYELEMIRRGEFDPGLKNKIISGK